MLGHGLSRSQSAMSTWQNPGFVPCHSEHLMIATWLFRIGLGRVAKWPFLLILNLISRTSWPGDFGQIAI